MPLARHLVLLAAVAFAFFWQGDARASALQLEPVSVRLTPTTRSAVLRLRNQSDVPMNVQVRAFRWQQVDGEDQLSATDALLVSPPIQQLDANGVQIVRVLLAETLTSEEELSFRLIVDELPGEPRADGQVQMLIRYSLPVTFRPGDLGPAKLSFQLDLTQEHPTIEASNSGAKSTQLSAMRLTSASGDVIELSAGLFGYVLAGQTRRWPIRLADKASIDQITGVAANVDGQARAFELQTSR
ncbi:MAG: fimbria/pilus periplasmic chaperone [Woeseia sp.]